MSVRRITLDGTAPLPADLRAAWEDLRAANPALGSPYFHPAYVEAVARAAPAPVTLLVEAASRDAAPTALLAVQGRRTVRPAGAPMSDYHGIISARGGDPRPLLARARMSVLPVAGWVGAGWVGEGRTCLSSPLDSSPLDSSPICRIDLSNGVEAWRATRDSSYTRHAKSHRRRVRKTAADIGEPRMVWRSRDVDHFNQLVAWKRAQFRSTAKFDVLGGWPLALLRDLWERGPDRGALRAEMQVLLFGDRPAAIDLGLSDGETFHSWIVAYDPELGTYAPGIQLLEALVAAAPELGYATLDLGVGLEGYKRHYANVEASVGVGTFRTAGARAALSRSYAQLEARSEPLARLRRRYTQISAVEPRPTARLRAMAQGLVAQTALATER